MYLYCYPNNSQHVLSYLYLEHDFTNVNNENLVDEFAKLGIDDGIKVIEEILHNQQLLSDETERLEIENYEFARFQAVNSVPFHASKPEPPKHKKESGEWRRQLIEYLRIDGFNEKNGKLQHTDISQPIGNLKSDVNRIPIPQIKEYYHVRIRMDQESVDPEDFHTFNLAKESLEKVVSKYNEEGMDNFYFNGRKIYPSDNFSLKIYVTWFDKLDIIRNKSKL